MSKIYLKAMEEVVHRNSDNTNRILEQAQGYVVSENATDTLLHTSFDLTTAQGVVKHLHASFLRLAQSGVRDIDPEDQLCFLRVRTRKYEFLTAPEEYFTVTVML
ncbi:dynein light chain roadblock-type 1 [Drosophila bipectinata]|uniref:dynein light chain roadblock-type 1 n=1 Tax=Drosophila bipectinata TaxID=42026 RepID=UPI0007E6EFBC|nr:dynein light chain roadblock-type 1 [Drosophila bipectinata]